MKLFILLLTYSFSAQTATILTYSYKKAQGAPTKTLELEEVSLAYNIIRRSSFNAPSAEIFFQDYLKFKLGVEIAYHEKKLVRDPNLGNKIKSLSLRGSFEQELYKAFAELELKNQMKNLDNRTVKLTQRKLRALYARNPEFSFQYISISHPVNPSAQQLQEVKERANKVYQSVSKSKKPFGNLVGLYSDEKVLGTVLANRSQAVIFPTVYSRLKKMRNGQVNRPIKVPTGYHVVRFNKRVAFENANQIAVKADFFNRERTRIFNNYFNLRRLKSQFKIKYVNRSLIKKL